jgi:hypothetical protein
MLLDLQDSPRRSRWFPVLPCSSEGIPKPLGEFKSAPAAPGVGLPASSRVRCIVRLDKHLGAQVRPSNISLRVAELEVCQSA